MRLLEAERPGFTEDSPKQLANERRVYLATILLTVAFGFFFSI